MHSVDLSLGGPSRLRENALTPRMTRFRGTSNRGGELQDNQAVGQV